jgi:hypothetical protein
MTASNTTVILRVCIHFCVRNKYWVVWPNGCGFSILLGSFHASLMVLPLFSYKTYSVSPGQGLIMIIHKYFKRGYHINV